MPRIWTQRTDTALVEEAFGSSIEWENCGYADELATNNALKDGHMSRLYRFSRGKPGSGLVLAKVGVWDDLVDPRQLYAFVMPGPLHTDGMYLSLYDGFEVRYSGRKTIQQRTGIERHDMLPHAHFIGRVFSTYNDEMNRRMLEIGGRRYIPRLLVIDSGDVVEGHPHALAEGMPLGIWPRFDQE